MIGIVVLNYLNYDDTIECIDSIMRQTYQEYKVVIVDNCSPNESYYELNDRYESDKIKVMKTKKNIGYARGNNIGIKYLIKECGIRKILILNNDVILNDKNYIKTLVGIKYDKNTGAIGTSIIGSDGLEQNPVNIKVGLINCLKSWLDIKLKVWNIPRKNKNIVGNNKSVNKEYILHGSAIYLTENYLKDFEGLYPKTFLYFEENILGMIFKKNNLTMNFIDNISLYHKEDQSSIASFGNNSKVKLNYSLKSVKLGIRLFFTSKVKIKKDINKYVEEE